MGSPLGELELSPLWGVVEDCVMLGGSLNPFEEKRLLDFASRKELWRQLVPTGLVRKLVLIFP